MTRYNKAVAAAASFLLGWALHQLGIDFGTEEQAALTTILVYAIPNVG